MDRQCHWARRGTAVDTQLSSAKQNGVNPLLPPGQPPFSALTNLCSIVVKRASDTTRCNQPFTPPPSMSLHPVPHQPLYTIIIIMDYSIVGLYNSDPVTNSSATLYVMRTGKSMVETKRQFNFQFKGPRTAYKYTKIKDVALTCINPSVYARVQHINIPK